MLVLTVKFIWRDHKSKPLVFILSQNDPIYVPILFFGIILILYSQLCLGLVSVLFPSGFPTVYTSPLSQYVQHASRILFFLKDE